MGSWTVGRAGGGGAVGLQGLLPGQVLHRFVEPISKPTDTEDKVGVQQRFVKQTAKCPTSAVWRWSGGAVLRRDEACEVRKET